MKNLNNRKLCTVAVGTKKIRKIKLKKRGETKKTVKKVPRSAK